ncbi:hypothetical protein MKX01_042822 [Papaver californicum]|nr:hypothetical protein MKX01_042822 [Papaver californicum]
MEENFWFITASTVIIVIAVAKFLLRNKKSSSHSSVTEWPAGPKTLPIIGNLHQLGGDDFHVRMANFAKVHGGVFTIWIGSWRPVIIINDIASAWEVLVTKSSDYSSKHKPDSFKDNSSAANEEKNINIAESDVGPFWINLRKGLQSVALGPLNVTSQTHLQERSMHRLIKSMKQKALQQNGIIKPLDYLKEESIRLLSVLIFGQDFSDEDFVVAMNRMLHDLVRIDQIISLADAFHIAKYLPSSKKVIQELDGVMEQASNLILPHINTSKPPPTNTYLHFLKSHCYSKEVIVNAIIEVYTLGVDSTSEAIVWALTFLVREPKIQEKLCQEIKNVTGGNRPVQVDDLKKMSYLQAVMRETLRMKPIGPVIFTHEATKDTSLMGKKVGKGTRIMVNLRAIHYNSKVFPQPYKFIPERYMKEEVNRDTASLGDREKMESSLIAFGAGMRVCAGMDLAKLMVPFGIASLVNEFRWDCVSDGKLPDLDEVFTSISLKKNTLEAKITPRID